MKYNELALKLIEKYADNRPRYLADICSEITADSIFVLRAIAELDQKFARVIIPKDYDPRKGPMIAISTGASGVANSELFGPGQQADRLLDGVPGFDFEVAEDCDDSDDSEEEPEGAEAFFQGMATDIHVMVMLEVMCHNVTSSATWMISAAESGAFGEDNEKVLGVAKQIMSAVGRIKGE